MINKIIRSKTTSQDHVLYSFMKSKNFYGEYSNKIQKNIIPFLYGIRENYCLINVKKTIIIFKRAFQLIRQCVETKKKILILGDSSEIDFLMRAFNISKQEKQFILIKNKEWANGLLTNSKLLKHKYIQNVSLVILLKSNVNEQNLITEVMTLNKPFIALNSINDTIENINYPILLNTKNFKSIFFIIYLFRKLIIK